MGAVRKEIGSEFSAACWPDPRETVCLPRQLLLGDAQALTWLGRTAIDLVLADILTYRPVRHVYMPSYCCDSMIAPFLQRGIAVSFYPVNFCGGLCVEPDLDLECDIFFSMNYFGPALPEQEAVLDAFRAKGAVIVEDITHSLFSSVAHHRCVDYAVASLRKWIESPAGGMAVKFGGGFSAGVDKAPPAWALTLRMEAMAEKAGYLQGEPVDKSAFLEKFGRFNASLEQDYRGVEMDSVTKAVLHRYDFDSMIQRRRENAAQLLSVLSDMAMVSRLQPEDCPLFVPILLPQGQRDGLRRHLIENQIYCPVHWPAPEGAVSNIYARELSLVCDQRYSVADMERTLATIGNFIKKD